MTKERKLLVIGHSLVIDTNRKFWSVFSQDSNVRTDLLAPAAWSSNLQSDIRFQNNPQSDAGINQIFKVPVFNKGNGSLYFHSPLKLFRILNDQQYDDIFLNQETWALSTLLIILIKTFSRNRKASLYLCVAQNIRKPKLAWLHPYERLISQFITAFLYCSEGVKDVLRWKGISTPCHYFPLPYDSSEFTTQRPPRNSQTFRIGYLGRLTEDKGIEILLSACEMLVGKGLDFKLVIGGKGPLESKLKTLKYVEFLGLIPHNEAHLFYKRIDCFILPSQTLPHWKEQFGRVITEAFASGCPLIGSDSGSIPEVLSKVHWNWIFPEKSPDELARMIVKLEKDLATEEGKRSLAMSVKLNEELFSHKSVSGYFLKILNRETQST